MFRTLRTLHDKEGRGQELKGRQAMQTDLRLSGMPFVLVLL